MPLGCVLVLEIIAQNMLQVLTGTVELALMSQGITAGVGLAALRALRALRIVKLVKELPSLQLVIGVIATAMPSIVQASVNDARTRTTF